MKNKRFTAKILIDIGMTICLLLLMPYSLLSETAHEWIGMAMLVLFISHYILNHKWVTSVRKGKYNAFRVIQTVLVIIMLILIMGSMISGILLSNHIFKWIKITEIEMTGISRYDAAVAIGRMFGTEPYHIRSYDSWCVKDLDGKTWKFSRDSSIDCERLANGTVIDADGDYSTEMVSPKLEYSEMGKLQEVVRCVKNAGAFVNSSCGMHVHVDASNHTPRSLKNALTIMYCKEDILFKALNVQTRREDEYCQKVRPMVLEKIRRMPNSTITMEKFKRAWYEGNDGSSEHYNWTRYYALNLHAVFSKGTLEWRCFESTLHAGKVRSNITLALAISAQAVNQSCTHAKKTEIGDNPAFTFRTFLLRLGLIGDEYKNVRKHLLANLDGDKAWRYDKSTYACLQNPRRTDDAR